MIFETEIISSGLLRDRRSGEDENRYLLSSTDLSKKVPHWYLIALPWRVV